MKSLSIVKKVWISLGILVVGYFLSMAIGYHLGQETEARLQGISENLFPASMMSSDAVNAFDEQIKLYYDAVLMGESSIFETTRQRADEVAKNLEAIVNMPGIDKIKKDEIDQTLQDHAAFSTSAQKIYAAMSSGDDSFIDEMVALANQTQEIQEKLAVFKNDLSKDLEDELENLIDNSKMQRLINVLLFAVVVVVAMLFAWFIITRAISRPLKNTVSMLRDIAEGEGDLTKRLEVKTNDEVGEMALWFNLFIDKLQGIIKDIASGVITLSSSSNELSTMSEQMTRGIQNVTDKSNTVSSAAEEMSTSMNIMAAAMEQSTTNTNMVATASEEMSSTIGEIAKNAEKARGISDQAATKASTASTNMGHLGHAANSIGNVVETITEISEKVNLLALNATIEAARAGEAGRGFTVVANEIKQLAKQTAEATHDIKQKIESIQGTTSTTVGQITEITQVINDVNDVVTMIATAVEEQSSATMEIATNVAQASRGIQEVNENINQSSTVSFEISKDINGVSGSMKEMSTISGQVNLSAQELSQLAVNLKKMIDQFKI